MRSAPPNQRTAPSSGLTQLVGRAGVWFLDSIASHLGVTTKGPCWPFLLSFCSDANRPSRCPSWGHLHHESATSAAHLLKLKPGKTFDLQELANGSQFCRHATAQERRPASRPTARRSSQASRSPASPASQARPAAEDADAGAVATPRPGVAAGAGAGAGRPARRSPSSTRPPLPTTTRGRIFGRRPWRRGLRGRLDRLLLPLRVPARRRAAHLRWRRSQPARPSSSPRAASPSRPHHPRNADAHIRSSPPDARSAPAAKPHLRRPGRRRQLRPEHPRLHARSR